MARRKHHRKSSHKRRRGIRGFSFGKLKGKGLSITKILSEGGGALASEFIEAKVPFLNDPVKHVKLKGVKSIVAGVGLQLAFGGNDMVDTACSVMRGVGIGQFIKGKVPGIDGFLNTPLQGIGNNGDDPLSNLSGVLDTPLQGGTPLQDGFDEPVFGNTDEMYFDQFS